MQIGRVFVDSTGYVKGDLQFYGDRTASEDLYLDTDTGRIAPYSAWQYWDDDLGYINPVDTHKERFLEVVTDGDGNWAVEGTYAAGEAEFLRAYYHFPTQDERLAAIQERLRGFSNEW
jgi:hypothetical protein